MRSSPSRIPPSRHFLLLMTASAVAVLLPSRFTDWTSRLLEPLIWVEWSIGAGLREGGRRLNDAFGTRYVPRGEFEDLQRENEDLRRRIAQQDLALRDLARLVDELSALRAQINPQARIIRATCVSLDASPMRASLIISAGAVHGVAAGDWVAAGPRTWTGDSSGRGDIDLARHWVLGRVSKVDPHRSRVQLASDPRFGPVRVYAARLDPGGQSRRAEEPCLLYGLGGGRMEIRSATANYLEDGYDHVVLPLPEVRPTFLTIGRLVSARPRPETALHYDLEVMPPGSVAEVTHVYVLHYAP